MTIQQVIDIAKYGELSQLSVKDDITGVLTYLNLGMLELYKRFPLKIEEHIITLVEGQSIYDMPENYMWIVAAYEEAPDDTDIYVQPIPINKEDDEKSVNTIGWAQVQVPLVTTGSFISIIYVAAPSIYTDLDLAEQIAIPPQMLEPLLHYIAFKAHGTMDNGAAEDNVHYQRFEMSCDRILAKGMFNQDDLYMTDRVNDRGFA